MANALYNDVFYYQWIMINNTRIIKTQIYNINNMIIISKSHARHNNYSKCGILILPSFV